MDVERPADGATILEVGVEFERGVVQGELRGARQLELAAGLERDAADGVVALQPDRVFAVEEGMPAGPGLDALQQGVDAVVALVGDRGERGFPIDVLFVLGADPPLRAGLAALRA